MARVCHEMVAVLRAEHAAGSPGVPVTGPARSGLMPCAEAADSLEAQARRWDAEVATGILNAEDRDKMGLGLSPVTPHEPGRRHRLGQ